MTPRGSRLGRSKSGSRVWLCATVSGSEDVHVVVLTHDVDWGRRGPPLTHVLERLERFSLEDRWRLLALRENIYDGISVILEAEERVYAKSTILFRPFYEDGSTVDLYADIASVLHRGGWEVGLHSNNAVSVESVARERVMVEEACGCRVVGHRAHYLRIDASLIPRLAEAGILVDSSICPSKRAPEPGAPGLLIYGSVVELPITVMDTYVFAYWGVRDEDQVVRLVTGLVEERWRRGHRYTTLLWHTNSVRMRGGRVYPRLLEELYAREYVVFARMVDVLELEGGSASPFSSPVGPSKRHHRPTGS